MPEAGQNEGLRAEFNRWAEAGRGEGMEQEHLPIVLPVLDQLRLERYDNVLDVGCGTGWLSRLLAEHLPEGRVVGVDISDEMIRHARRKHASLDNAMFVTGEADELPWDAGFFTHAVSVESAYYWPNAARSLRDIFRVLREGGSAWILINYYRENPYSYRWADSIQVPMHLFSESEWTELFRGAGFEAIESRRIPDPTPAPPVYEGRWFRDTEELRAFREAGALLIHGRRPIP